MSGFLGMPQNLILYMTTDLSKYDNSWYNPGANVILRLLWYYANLLVIKNPWNPLSGLRVVVLRMFGAKIGKGVVLKPGINIKYPWMLSIGDYSWIGEDVWIDNLAPVTIGANCCISQGAMLLCGNHNYRKPTFDLMVRPISVEDGAWVGAKCVLCPGVTVHSHSVISVGSVVTKDTEPYKIFQGIPATFKSER